VIALLSIVLGGLVGLALGMVGGGGSILTVPALIYGLGIPVEQAVPASLVLVGLIAGVGALTHARDGTVRFDVALRFGLAGVAGAVAGARLSRLVEPRLLLSLFAFLMMAAAISLVRRDSRRTDAAAERARAHPVWWGRLVLAGLGVGALTGFFGVGGGFIIVPALALFVGLPTRQAVATSLVVIVINCVSALAGHMTAGGSVPLLSLTLFAAGGFAGSSGGARLAGRWQEKHLARLFAALVAGVAIYLIVRNTLGL
jgi:uncharacterized membrane protein YfcA